MPLYIEFYDLENSKLVIKIWKEIKMKFRCKVSKKVYFDIADC